MDDVPGLECIDDCNCIYCLYDKYGGKYGGKYGVNGKWTRSRL